MNKSDRLMQELIFLRDKTYFQLKDLMEEFNISKRTAIRDVFSLQDLGLSLTSETGPGGGYKIVYRSNRLPIYFSSGEIQAVFFALKALETIGPSPFKKKYSSISQKLLAKISLDQQKMIEKTLEVMGYYGVSPVRETRDLDVILDSLLKSQVLSVSYRANGKYLSLQFFELFYRNGIWFGEGYDHKNEKWGTFRIDQVKILTSQSPQEFFPLTRSSLKKKKEEYEASYHYIPFKCLLTKAGKEKFLRNHYPNMVLEEDGGNFYLTGGYNPEEFDYMVEYLIGLGKEVRVLGPEELASAYKKDLEEILGWYR